MVGENIKRIRQEKGITQKQLGEILGISQSAVGQFETNKPPQNIKTLKRIADALDVSVSDLVSDLLDHMTPKR